MIVGYLIDIIMSTDVNVVAALASIRMDGIGRSEDFEEASIFLDRWRCILILCPLFRCQCHELSALVVAEFNSSGVDSAVQFGPC